MKFYLSVYFVCASAFCIALPVQELFYRSKASESYYAGNFGGAQQYFENLLIEHPAKVEYMRGLGDSFYAQGNYRQALFYYEQALKPYENTQDKRELYFNVGCAQAQLHDYAAALQSFERVIALDNTHERAKKNRDILKKLLEESQHQQQNQKNKDDRQDKQQNSKQKESDQQKSDNKDERDNNTPKDGQKEPQERDQKPKNQRDKQPEQKNNEQAEKQRSEQQRPEQKMHENAQQQVPREQQRGERSAAEKNEKKLDQSMRQLLQQVDALDKQGQHLYMQAITGQRTFQKRSEHDW